MSTDLQGSISAAISKADAKAAEKTEGNFSQDIAKDKVAQARNRISVAEAKVQKNQTQIADIDNKIANPPTQEVSAGGALNAKESFPAYLRLYCPWRSNARCYILLTFDSIKNEAPTRI